jgi:hypothetical protein
VIRMMFGPAELRRHEEALRVKHDETRQFDVILLIVFSLLHLFFDFRVLPHALHSLGRRFPPLLPRRFSQAA